MGQYYSEFTVDGVKKDIYDKHAVHLDDFSTVLEEHLVTSTIKNVILESLFPIGSGIICRNDPGTFLGGEWEQLKDVVIVGAGGKFSYGQTGGYANPTLPSHTHPASGGTDTSGPHSHSINFNTEPAGYHSHSMINMFSAGAGGGLARYKTTSDRMSGVKYTEPAANHIHHIAGPTSVDGYHSHSVDVTVDARGDTNITDKNYPPFKALNIWIRTA